MKKRITSLFLVFCMLMSMIPGSVLAAEAKCTNHLEHDSTCGWREASESSECRHEHDDSCGYVKSGVCGHTEHDAFCGYSESMEAAECTHSCELCSEVKTDANYFQPAEDESVNTFSLEQKCSCETLCSNEARNADCPVCSVDEADLSACLGTAKDIPKCSETESDQRFGSSQQNENNVDTPTGENPSTFASGDSDVPAAAGTLIASGTCGDYGDVLTWTLDDTGLLTISGSGCMSGNTHNFWGEYKDTISSLVIEPGVTYISSYAFNDCSNLTTVTIPDTLAYIDAYAFRGCSSLTGVYISDLTAWCEISYFEPDENDGNPLQNAGNLYVNDELLTELVIPDEITEINSYAFCGGSCITSVTIPEGITSIGERAFSGCNNLASVTIPASLTNIDDAAFEGSKSLAGVYINDLAAWCNISFGGTSANPLAYAHNLYIDGELVTDLVFSEGITSISDYAFYDCNSLTDVTISDSVTSVGKSAFHDCSNLINVTIPDGVTSIGEEAFRGCSSLTSVTIPDGVTSIGDFTFSGCSSLTSATIPGGVTSIGIGAFGMCTGLTSVTIPGSVTSIDRGAFELCNSLTSVTIPDGVTYIGDNAFAYCNSLTSVTIPDSVTSIGVYTFYDCWSLTSVTIPDSVTSIGEEAFAGSALTDVYYAGSEKDWLKITNNSSSIVPDTATIHFNSTGPDDTGGDVEPPVPVITTGIKYLSSYDANTGLAYFDQVYTPYDTGYAVTEETVIDSETGIEGLVGSYVMVEDSVAGDQLEIVSIKALNSNVSKVAGYGPGQLFLIKSQNSQLLQLPCGLDNLESYNGKYVLYHCYDGESEIVALEVLSTYIGTLNTWENSNIKVDREFYYTNGLTVFENKEGELLATGDMVEVCVSDRIPSQPTALKVRHLIHETRVGTLERVDEGVAYIDGEPLSVDAERFEQDLVPMVGERIYYTLESGLIVYADTLSSLGYNVFVETRPDGLSAVYENDSFTPEEQKFTVTINYVCSGHIPDYCDKEVIYAQVNLAPLVISSAEWENDSGLEISVPELKNVSIAIGGSTQFDCTASFYEGILGIGKYEPEETVEVLTGFLKIEGSIGEEKYQREKVVDVRMTVTNEALRKEEEEFSIWAVTLLESLYAVKAVDVTAENMILKNYFSNATVNDIGHLITLWAAAMDSEIAAEKMSTLPECIKIDCVMDKGSRKGHRASLIFEFKKADFGTTINSFLEAFGFKNAGSDSGSIQRITVTIVDHDAESGPACMPDQLFSVGVSADVKGFADSMNSYLSKKYGKNLDDMLKRLVKDTVSDAAKEFIDKAISSMDGKEYVDTILTLNKEYKYVVEKAKELSSFCDRWSLPESQTYIFTSNLDFTLMQDSEAEKYIFKFIKVDCPVNVYVYDPDGNLCGAIENNEVTVDNLETFLYVDGESKNIWVSNNDYRIEIIATDNGTMDYSVSEFFGGDNTRTVLFHDLPLTALSTYKGVVPDTPPESADSYALTTETGETVFPDEIISYEQTLNNIAITTQPKLSYKEGDLLDLSSMVITASYSNGSSNTLSYNDSGVGSSLAHGTALNAGIHNGNVITISYGGKTADTEALTVSADTNVPEEDIPAAKTAIRNHNWTVSQTVANSSDSIKVWIENELNGLDLHGVSVADIVVVSFSPAVAGTSEKPNGTNGSYSFSVRLSTGNETDSITVNTGAIMAVTYTAPGHTHKWSAAWSYNETHHWHDCTGSGICDADNSTAGKAYDEHAFRRWRTVRAATSTTTGLKERSCTVCGYTQQTTIPIGTSPMSGDSANLTLWLSLMVLSIGVLGFTGYKLRRRKTRN